MTLVIDIAFASEDNEAVVLKLMSEDSGLIIGKRGKTLEAIQLVANIALNKGKDNWKKVILDIEGYRTKREEALRMVALRAAERVRITGRPKILESMNPFERRLIHITLQDFNDIDTVSEGEGIFKRVKVYRKAKKRFKR
jgi:spoIIIJ-associated protein